MCIFIYNGIDRGHPYTHGYENNNQQQNIQNTVRKSVKAAEMPDVIPGLSNTHVSTTGEKEPKYFTVRECRKQQFTSTSCALGQ